MTALDVRVGVATRPVKGETECGDLAAFACTDGVWSIVLADGLGHGPDAAVAARAVVGFVLERPEVELGDLMRRCDRAVTHTRGAALTVLRIDAKAGDVVHAGVGNVDVAAATLHPTRLIAMPGIVGARMRKVVATRHRVSPGDVLVLHTDGISRRFQPADFRDTPVAEAAALVLSRHGLAHDDATCVFVRC